MLTKLFCKAQTLVTEFKNDERGVTAIEYGLIAVAMAAALAIVFADSGTGSLLGELKSAFQSIISDISTVSSQSASS